MTIRQYCQYIYSNSFYIYFWDFPQNICLWTTPWWADLEKIQTLDTVACTNYAYKEGKNNLTNNHAWQRDFSTGSEPVFSFTLSCGTYPSSAEASRSWVIIVVETCWQIAQYSRAAVILQSLKQLARTVVTCRRTEAHNKCFGNRQKMCPLNNPHKWKTVSEFCTRFQFQAQIS